jgi:hypothetical protein
VFDLATFNPVAQLVSGLLPQHIVPLNLEILHGFDSQSAHSLCNSVQWYKIQPMAAGFEKGFTSNSVHFAIDLE